MTNEKEYNSDYLDNKNSDFANTGRNFLVQDPLLQQQLGLLSDKRNFLEKLNKINCTSDDRKSYDKEKNKEKEKDKSKDKKYFSSRLEGEKYTPNSAPFSSKFPQSLSTTKSREDLFQNSLLSARADIHGILAKSVNYHGGELIGKFYGF